MDRLKSFTKKLRMILYRIDIPDELKTEFERVISEYNYQVELSIIEKNDVIIVDLIPYIQYTKTKGLHKRIYEVIPLGSPLYKRRSCNERTNSYTPRNHRI